MDGNHAEIVAALRAAGCSVQSLAAIGGGCPDLLVGRNGRNLVLEIKDTGGRLTPDQKRWHADWRGKAHIAHGPDEAIRIVEYWTGDKCWTTRA